MDSASTREAPRRRLVWAVCLLVGLGLGNGLRAEESPLLEHVDQLMIDIGAQLTNARKKLKMSSGVVEQNPNGESGMGLTCCSRNLLTIAEKLQGIRAALDRMAAYYTEEENGEAMGLLGQLDTQVKSISTGAIVFGRSPDEKHASAALTGFVRPWNGFRNGVQALRLCCPIPIPVTADTEGEDAADDAETGKAAD